MRTHRRFFFMNVTAPKVATFSVGLIAIVALLAIAFFGKRGGADRGRGLYSVERTTLSIVIAENGALKARESTQIKPDIESQARIITIVEEGTYVKKGGVLVELDKSEIENALTRLTLELLSAETNLLKAKANLEKYENAEYGQQKQELEFKIEKAKAKRDKALEQQPKPEDERLYSRSEIRDAQLAVDEARMDLESAQIDYDVFVNYTHPQTLRERKNALRAAESTYDIKLGQKRDADEQLAKMTIVAPNDGLVIYGEPGGGRRFRDTEREVAAGALVYKNQVIITLPDVMHMRAGIRVHEVDIQKINKGQKATIRIEAFPKLRLTGTVTQIGALAREQDGWRSRGVMVFDVDIDIDQSLTTLRPGMTAKVDLLVDNVPDVLTVPVEAIFEDDDGTHYCHVRARGGYEKRTVALGKSNHTHVVVTDGLGEGDRVYVYDPSRPPRT